MRFKQQSKPETDERIYVTDSALAKLEELTNIMDELEFNCASCATKDEPHGVKRTVVDFLVVPHQQVIGSKCIITGVADSIRESNRKGLLQIGIAHGHGHHGTMHSSLDDTALGESVVSGCHTNNMEQFYEKAPIILIGDNLRADFINGWVANINYPKKTVNAVKRINQPGEVSILTRKVSRIYSIVANKAKTIYGEIWYRDEDVITGKKSYNNKVALIEEATNQKYTAEFTRDSLVKDLVKAVFFPNAKGSVPSAFKAYLAEYHALTQKPTYKNFATNAAAYLTNPKAKQRTLLRDALFQIDDTFAERIKFSDIQIDQDPRLTENNIFALVSYFANSGDCPDWFYEFMERFAHQEKSRIFRIEKNENKDIIIDAFNEQLKTIQAKLDYDDACAEDDIDSYFIQNQRDKIEVKLGAEWLNCLKQIYDVNKDRVDEDVAKIYGFAQLIHLSLHDFSLDDLEKIKEAKKTLTAIRTNTFDRIYAAIAEKEFKLHELLLEKGYSCPQQILLPQISPSEVYSNIENTVKAQIKQKEAQYKKIRTPYAGAGWLKNAFIEIEKLQRNMLNYRKIFPSEDIDNLCKILNTKKSNCKKQIEDLLKSLEQDIDLRHKRKDEGKIKEYEKVSLGVGKRVDDLRALPKKYREQCERIKTKYNALIK